MPRLPRQLGRPRVPGPSRRLFLRGTGAATACSDRVMAPRDGTTVGGGFALSAIGIASPGLRISGLRRSRGGA
jgi:hypothetical protein